MDRLLSTHVMALHGGRAPPAGLLGGAAAQGWGASQVGLYT